MTTAIVWFRRDLRLDDNPALTAALRAQDRVLCAYVHAPDEDAPWAPGAASRWWLHHSLAALDADLRKRGGELHIARGASARVLAHLVRAAAATAVYWNRVYEPAAAARDAVVEDRLRAAGIATRAFNATLLVEPSQMQTGAGGPYKVFTPFWRALSSRLEATPPQAAPRRVATMAVAGSLRLDALGLLPRLNWADGFADHWTPGAGAALRRARRFVADAIAAYPARRDRPDEDGTSRLSPHLHFGEIGPRQLLWMIEQRRHGQRSARAEAGADGFVRELGWREFAHHLLHHFPHTPERNFNPAFDRFSWSVHGDESLHAWRRGATGIPIVDAGMRQLWQSGWMHNRVRMLVASLLTKNLRAHWLHGARWFWDTLVDADLANNTLGWQWTAGSGADAAPYFRIFNPVTQGERFDPDGAYVRRWVPELRDAPSDRIHAPWRDPALLARTGYPPPIVDLGASRAVALDAYARMRGEG